MQSRTDGTPLSGGGVSDFGEPKGRSANRVIAAKSLGGGACFAGRMRTSARAI